MITKPLVQLLKLQGKEHSLKSHPSLIVSSLVPPFLTTSLMRFKSSSSSKAWMKRHVSDKYVIKASVDNYRARSAYKLIEINKTARILKKGKSTYQNT